MTAASVAAIVMESIPWDEILIFGILLVSERIRKSEGLQGRSESFCVSIGSDVEDPNCKR